MKINVKRELLIALLIGVFITLPFYADAATGADILYGKDAVSKNLKRGDLIYFGHASGPYTGKALWRIGSLATSNTEAPDAMFLISEYTWRGPTDAICFNANYQAAGAQNWQGSDGQKWCSDFYNANFSSEEKTHIVSYNKTDKAGSWYGTDFGGCRLTAGDKVFWLSADELWSYVYFDMGKKLKANDINGNITAYWLRSPRKSVSTQAGFVESKTGGVSADRTDMTTVRIGSDQSGYQVIPYAARPALNISTKDLLFASAIGAKRETVGSLYPAGSAGREYKLTYKDPGRRVSVTGVSNKGSVVTIKYSGATTGSTSYVSGMIVNNGAVRYYGRLAKDSASGTVAFPASYITKGDTIYLFSEKSSSAYDTDYASEPIEVSIPKADPAAGGGTAGKGATAEAANYAITTLTSDKDLNGSGFAPLKLRSDKQGNSSIRLRWSKADGATSYVIYGNLCNTKKKVHPLMRIGSTAKSQINIKKLKKGKYYKFVVVALDPGGNIAATSKTIHVTTKGGSKTNHKGVRVPGIKKSVLTVKAGKSKKLNARAVGGNVSIHKKLRYESSDPAVAAVKKGKVKGVSKGSCSIYVYTQNGKYKRVKVKVI